MTLLKSIAKYQIRQELRLFQLIDLKTNKRVGQYYENKQHAKAARDSSMKVSPGPDHRRYNHDRH